MNFTYDISETNEVKIFSDGFAAVTQPISPITGEPFATYEEAVAWAESVIAERQSWYA
jgi:hypothetical protein